MWIYLYYCLGVSAVLSQPRLPQNIEPDPCRSSPCGPKEICVTRKVENCTTPVCDPIHECLSTSRSGSCPATIPEFHPDFGRCTDHCAKDVDCPRQEKCCMSSCGARVCVNPALKEGQCPSLETSYIGLCVAQCTADSDCQGTKKCCGGCPRLCVEPVNPTEICRNIDCPPGYGCHLAPVVCKTSPCFPLASCLLTKKLGGGVCPIHPLPKSDTCIDDCTVDGQCPLDEICCKLGCHRVCRSPRVAVPKRGKCPRKSITMGLLSTSELACKPECAVDHDCISSMKCCGDCGKCVKPRSTVKPGKCPDNPFSVFPIIGIKLRCKSRQYCSNDNDCVGTRKCCGVCPRKCQNVTPKTTRRAKTPKCPAIVHVVNCKRSRVKKCVVNADCRSKSLCCPSVTCGKVCVRVIVSRRTWWRG